MQRALRAALPRHIRLDAFVRTGLAAMQSTPLVYECTHESILQSIMNAAAYGLVPDGGALGHGYLVPYWNSKASRRECKFIPGYRGLVKLARNSGEVADVWAEVVHEADMEPPGVFKYELGLNQTLEHKRNDTTDDAGQLIYAYAVARFKDGERRFVVMNRREVLAIKSKSASRTKSGEVYGPWLDHEAEMWKKTAIRRLSKMLPLSPDVQKKLIDEDEDMTDTIDAFSSVSVSVPQLPQESAEPVGITSHVGDGAITWQDEIAGCDTVADVERVRAAWSKLITHDEEIDEFELAANLRIKAISDGKA